MQEQKFLLEKLPCDSVFLEPYATTDYKIPAVVIKI